MDQTFGQVLKSWKDSKHIDCGTLSKRSGIPVFKIKLFLSDQEQPTPEEIKQLSGVFGSECSGFKLLPTLPDPATLRKIKKQKYATPEQYRAIVETYCNYPSEYRKHLSKMIVDHLIDTTGLTGMQIEKRCDLAIATISNIKKLKYSLSEETLSKINRCLVEEGTLVEGLVYNKLDELGKHYISNYNLYLAKQSYQFANERLSAACRRSPATISNILTYKYTITPDLYSELHRFFDIPFDRFKCEILSKKMFNKEGVLDNINKAAEESSVVTFDNVEDFSIDEQPVPEPVTIPYQAEDDSNTVPDFVRSLDEDSEKLLKIYSNLSGSNKKELIKKAEELFWKDF